MPVINYSQTPIIIKHNSQNYTGLALSASVSYANQLESYRSLAPNQINNFRIGGPSSSKLSMTLVACGKNGFNAPNILINTLTGDVGPAEVYIGGNVFSGCYCNSVSVEVSPFAPITISSELESKYMPENTPFIAGTSITDLSNIDLAHAYNTVISGGSTLSDSNYGSFSYQVNCSRSHPITIGSTKSQTMFLDSVEKQLNIKSTNIGNFIDYSGYGAAINIDIKSDSGISVISPVIGLSAKARIVSQNLSVSEGGILGGEVSLRETVF